MTFTNLNNNNIFIFWFDNIIVLRVEIGFINLDAISDLESTSMLAALVKERLMCMLCYSVYYYMVNVYIKLISLFQLQ